MYVIRPPRGTGYLVRYDTRMMDAYLTSGQPALFLRQKRNGRHHLTLPHGEVYDCDELKHQNHKNNSMLILEKNKNVIIICIYMGVIKALMFMIN